MFGPRLVLVAMLFVTAVPLAGHADEAYPNRPIRLIVPYPAGGGMDAIARTIAQKLSPVLGQPFVIEDRPGAGTLLAAEMVAKAAPDGYTLLWASSATLGISPAMYEHSPIDPLKDFTPVAMGTHSSFLLVIHPSIPARTMADFIAYVKARPGQLNYGSAGNGSPHHLFMEILKGAAGLDIVHVPYKGSGAAAADLLTGRIVMMISDLLPVVEHIKTGELIVLAMADQKRSPLFPDVPAIAETVPGFNVLSWTGLIAPAGTPPDIVNRLATPMLAIVRSPDYARDIVKFGMEPLPMTPDEFTAFLAEDVPRWAAVVKRTGAHVD